MKLKLDFDEREDASMMRHGVIAKEEKACRTRSGMWRERGSNGKSFLDRQGRRAARNLAKKALRDALNSKDETVQDVPLDEIFAQSADWLERYAFKQTKPVARYGLVLVPAEAIERLPWWVKREVCIRSKPWNKGGVAVRPLAFETMCKIFNAEYAFRYAGEWHDDYGVDRYFSDDRLWESRWMEDDDDYLDYMNPWGTDEAERELLEGEEDAWADWHASERPYVKVVMPLSSCIYSLDDDFGLEEEEYRERLYDNYIFNQNVYGEGTYADRAMQKRRRGVRRSYEKVRSKHAEKMAAWVENQQRLAAYMAQKISQYRADASRHYPELASLEEAFVRNAMAAQAKMTHVLNAKPKRAAFPQSHKAQAVAAVCHAWWREDARWNLNISQETWRIDEE